MSLNTLDSIISCEICEELSDESFFLKRFPSNWPFKHRILYENESIYIVPGIGPQVYPYLIMFTKAHYSKFSELKETDIKFINMGFEFLVREGIFKTGFQYFEHANCVNSSKAGCIEHAHIHIMDLSIKLFEAAKTLGFEPIKSEDFYFKKRTKYLMIGKQAEDESVILINENPPEISQYFRRIIAGILSQDFFNWRTQFNEHLLLKLAQDYQHLFTRNNRQNEE